MLNIDKLRYNWEKPFLNLINGLETKIHPIFPNKKLFYNNKGWFFEYDTNTRKLICQYDRVWSRVEKIYPHEIGNHKIQQLIKSLIERYYKLKNITPLYSRNRRRKYR